MTEEREIRVEDLELGDMVRLPGWFIATRVQGHFTDARGRIAVMLDNQWHYFLRRTLVIVVRNR